MTVGFEVLTVVVMKSTIFWDIMPRSPLKVNWRFGALDLALLATCFHAGFLLGLFFDPKDGSDMFLQIVCWLSADYMALYPEDNTLQNNDCQQQ
jgi:hypothetical protein